MYSARRGKTLAPLSAYRLLCKPTLKDDEARYQLAMLAERMGNLDTMESLLRQVITAEPKPMPWHITPWVMPWLIAIYHACQKRARCWINPATSP